MASTSSKDAPGSELRSIGHGPPQPGPNPPDFPGPGRTLALMAANALCMFLVSLNRTIVTTAVPKISDTFHSINDVGWYGSAFLLTSCCVQLLLGKVYTSCVIKWVYITSIFVFEIGAAVCGAAPSSTAFIIGRAISGIGSSGIQNGAIILLTVTVPLAKRPIWLGALAATFELGSVVGPLLGGVLTTDATWRWCFYINLPIGGAAAGILLVLLKASPPRMQASPKQLLLNLDPIGTALIAPALLCLLLALQWGGTEYAWDSGRVIALLVVFAVLTVCWAIVQAFMQKTATIKKEIIWNRDILASFWFVFCLGSTMLIMIYFVPIYFQAIKGVSAVRSGIDTLPLVLSMVFGSVTSGQIVSRTGWYAPWAIASSVFMPTGTGLVSTWKTSTNESLWIGSQILVGYGIGIGMQQGSLAAQAVLSGLHVPVGISLMFFAQMLGGAVFISVGQNLLTQRLVVGFELLGLDASQVANTGATDIRSAVPTDVLQDVLEFYVSGLRHTFWLATALAAASILGSLALRWINIKKKRRERPPQPLPQSAP